MAVEGDGEARHSRGGVEGQETVKGDGGAGHRRRGGGGVGDSGGREEAGHRRGDVSMWNRQEMEATERSGLGV